MSTIEILFYLFGTTFFLSVSAFTYYSYKNARLMRGPLGHQLMTMGGILSLGAAIVGALDHFLFPGSGVVYAEFTIWVTGLLAILTGSVLRARDILKVRRASLMWMLRMMPRARIYLIAIAGLLLVSLPLSILSLFSPLVAEPRFHNIANLIIWTLAFMAMAVAERKLHHAVHLPQPLPERAALRETPQLEEDLLTLRVYSHLMDNLLSTTLPIVGLRALRYSLSECAREHKLLERCEITDAGTVAIEDTFDTLEDMPEEEGISMVLEAFSCMLSHFLDLLMAVASPEFAREVMSKNYRPTKAQYGDLQALERVLETVPEGFLKEERLALLSKDKLEAHVRERTEGMEEALTHARKAGEALRVSKASFLNIVQRSPDGIVVLDRSGKVRFANPTALAFFEHDAQQIGELVDLPIAPDQKREIDIVRGGGKAGVAELSVVETEWEGEDTYLALLRDITDRKRAEQALRKSEEKYRKLVEESLQGVVVVQDFRVVFANSRFSAISGYTVEELTSLSPEEIKEVVHPEDQALVWGRLRDRLAGKSVPPRYEYRGIRKSGEVRWLEMFAALVEYQGRPAIQATVVDITERKRATQALRESEAKYRSLIEQSEDAVYVLYEDKFDLVNPKFQELFGVTQEDVRAPDFDFRSLVAPQSLSVIEERTRKLAAGQEPSPRYEFTALDKEGNEIEVEVSASYVPYKGGIATQGVLRDVTERKRLEETLRRRAEELAALQATVLDITIEHDLPTLLRTIVERAAQLLDAPAGGMYLCDAERQEVRCVVSHNTPADFTGTVLDYGEGAAGAVAQTGEPLIIDDYRTWSGRATTYEEDQPFTAVLSAPMTWQGEVIGVIHVLHDIGARRFTEDDLELLTLLANHAAIAVENARLHEETQQRAIQLEALREVGLEITAQLDLDELLHSIVSQAIKLLGGVGGGLYLYQPEQDALEFVTIGGRQAVPPGSILHRGEGLSGKVWESGEPLIVTDYQNWEERAPKFEGLPIASVVAVPIRWGDEFLGVLTTEGDASRTFSPADAELLSLFASQAAIAIRNARLYEETERRATQSRLIYEVEQHVSSELELDVLLSTIVSSVREAFDYHNVILLLLNEEQDRLTMQSIAGAYTDILPDDLWLAVSEGMIGHAAATGETQVSNDVSKDPHYVRKAAEDTQSELAVPIKSGQEVIGVLDLQDDELDAFDEIDVSTVETLSNQIATAMENARLFEAERKRSMQLATVSKVAESITSTLDPHEVLNRTVELITQSFGYYYAGIMLLDPEVGDLVFEAGAGGFAGRTPSDFRQELKKGMIGWAAHLGETMLANDVRQEPRYIPAFLTHTRSELDVPLKYRDMTIGVLTIQSREINAFDEHDAMAMEALAGHVAAAIENARLYEKTQKHTAQLEALHEVEMEITTQLDLDVLLHEIVERAIQLLNGEAGGVYLHQSEPDVLEWALAIGEHTAPLGTRLKEGEGLSGKVWATGEPVIVENYAEWSGKTSRWPPIDRSIVGVPIQWGDDFLGVLNIRASRSRSFFTQEDADLLAHFANQAAIAIQNARLFEEIHQRALEQETLREAALAMTTALERDEVVEHILAQLQEVVPYDTASVQLLRDDTLEIVGGRGFTNLEELLGFTFDPNRTDNPNREVVRNRAPHIVEDAPTIYEEFGREPHAQAGIRSWLGVPMLVGDQIIGMIALDKQESEFYDEEHAQLAEAFAAQAAVAIENARLYEEVRRQADELAAAVDQLRELDRLKSEFIQNVSHELRSPLALIRGYAEMLDTGELGEVDPIQEEPIAIIARRARMLGDLVQDITLILEAETSPPKPEPVPLDELASAAVEDFQISAGDAELTLETEIAPDLSPVRGAPTHLRRVLDNLIGNAIKFTDPRGSVTVRVKQPKEDRVLLVVSDTGIGIRADQQERIFERFYQVDGSTKRRYRGTGLGLALVKEIVETYGGEISVESEVGEGSTFTVALPVYNEEESQQQELEGA